MTDAPGEGRPQFQRATDVAEQTVESLEVDDVNLGDDKHFFGSDIDLSGDNSVELDIDIPSRADTITTHVQGSQDKEVTVQFLDPNGNIVTERGKADNDGYEGLDDEDVFGDTQIASRNAKIIIESDGVVNYSVYVR